MNRKLYTFVLLCVSLLYAGSAAAQCPTGRYFTEIFSAYRVDSVVYSLPYSLKMDIYQPAGDTLAKRPLIILAHGGSFVGGTRTDDTTVVRLCQNFAKRGYVTASIDYRLGNIVQMVADSNYAIDVVIKAISDGKAAQRFFVKDAATSDSFRIDTNNIYIGGNSAGAVLYMHVGYIDSIAECPPNVAAAMNANGGFEGNSGDTGYTTRSKAVINLAGALNTTAFIGAGDKPSVNAQGDNDATVPYNCGYPISGAVHVNLCGLGQLEPAYNAHGIYHMSKVFPGDAHVPWDSDPLKFNSVDSLITVFLYNLVCTNALGVTSIAKTTETLLYPNPANGIVNINSSDMLDEVLVCDQTGRIIFRHGSINNTSYILNTTHYSKGIYFVKIRFSDVAATPLVKSVVIE